MDKEQEYFCKIKSQKFFDTIGWSITWGLKVAGIIFIGVITWRISNANIDISNFKDCNFNDLLSLILALFAILISVLFYFKSTESSNKFYSDTYRFTKDISESIGRIDERFGEKMTSLYDNFKRLDSYLHNQPSKVEKEIKTVEATEQKATESKEKSEQEYQEIINNLITRTKIDGEEKDKLLRELQRIQQERDEAIEAMSLAQHKLKRLQARKQKDYIPFNSSNYEDINNQIKEFFMRTSFSHQIEELGFPMAKAFFHKIKNDHLPSSLLDDMQRLDYLDSEGELTNRGYKMLKEVSNAL
ncbi:hypothetical protein [uncultured Victivallis sp.]|uniref:hypothetical protein n=1 Tax=uncultured Victivallis sp. TaxID=354118 RepID=UPI0025948144|nr:hypothetical protein [uncultured Victivallis sp.]